MSIAELSSAGANSELLQRQGWSGVRFDGDEEDRAKVPNMHKAFLTPFNVLHVFRAHNVTTEVDYVSIDIDSCDLWIFLALTDTYRPAVVSVEYQANYFFNESITNVCVAADRGKLWFRHRPKLACWPLPRQARPVDARQGICQRRAGAAGRMDGKV